MREIDLIPASYRDEQRLRRLLKVAAASFSAVLVALLSVRVALGYALDAVQSEIATLQVQQTITAQESDELTRLSERRTEYERQLQLLEGLRSGTAAENMFRIIDRALIDQDVWFSQWEFRRAGLAVGAEPKTVNTGYFVVVPNGKETDAPEAWQIETHMKISGQARDHAALAEFVKRMLLQAGIKNVRVRRTALRRYAAITVVDFDLAVVVDGSAGG